MPRFTTSDGVAISYDHDDSAPGEHPPVVLLHGFAVSAQLNFGAPGVIDALADADRSTLAIDARGHGDSDTPDDPARYGEARMARDVRELLDELGITDYDLVGYSMGSVVALLLAIDDPRVRRLVLGGVGAGIVEVGGVDQRALPPHMIIQAMQAPDRAAVEFPLGQAWRAFAETVGANLPALAAQAAAMHQSPLALERVQAPTLVLAASTDGLASRPEVLVDALPDARLKLLAGDHLGLPTNPRFTAAIVEFLSETGPAAEAPA